MRFSPNNNTQTKFEYSYFNQNINSSFFCLNSCFIGLIKNIFHIITYQSTNGIVFIRLTPSSRIEDIVLVKANHHFFTTTIIIFIVIIIIIVFSTERMHFRGRKLLLNFVDVEKVILFPLLSS